MGFACPHTEALPPRGPLTCLWPQPALFQQERGQSLSISSSYQEPVPVRRPTQLLGSDLVPTQHLLASSPVTQPAGTATPASPSRMLGGLRPRAC